MALIPASRSERRAELIGILPSGRALLVGWERMNGANDLAYQKHFLPLLASLKLLK